MPRGVYLTAEQVDAILALRGQGRSQRAIAVELRLSRGAVGAVLADPQPFLDRAARYAAARGPKSPQPELATVRCLQCGGLHRVVVGEPCPKCTADAHREAVR
jgi:hypothetical protein